MRPRPWLVPWAALGEPAASLVVGLHRATPDAPHTGVSSAPIPTAFEQGSLPDMYNRQLMTCYAMVEAVSSGQVEDRWRKREL